MRINYIKEKIMIFNFRKIFCLILFVFITTVGYSFPFTDETEYKKYHEVIDKKFILSTSLSLNMTGISFSHIKNTSDTDNPYSEPMDYLPNISPVLGCSASYKGLGISFNKGLSFIRRDDSFYGKTDYTDLQMNYFWKKLALDLYYQNYKGYYFQFPETFGLSRGDPITKRGDLSSRLIGFNFSYFFSDTFSMAAAFQQSEKQPISGGSPLVMVSYRNYIFNSDYSLIVPSEELIYEKYSGLRKGAINAGMISVGYAHTLTSHNFYITPVVCFGLGYNYVDYGVSTGNVKTDNSCMKIIYKMAMGYNGNNFFMGLFGSAEIDDTSSIFGYDTDISFGFLTLKCSFFSGIRI